MKPPFAYGNDNYVMTYLAAPHDMLRPVCSCGWTTEAAALASTTDRAVEAHVDHAHAGPRNQWVRSVPVTIGS